MNETIKHVRGYDERVVRISDRALSKAEMERLYAEPYAGLISPPHWWRRIDGWVWNGWTWIKSTAGLS